jgi:hypothetical protein
VIGAAHQRRGVVCQDASLVRQLRAPAGQTLQLLAVADGHVVLATAADHRLAAPVDGRYRGTGVNSSLDYRVSLATAAA